MVGRVQTVTPSSSSPFFVFRAILTASLAISEGGAQRAVEEAIGCNRFSQCSVPEWDIGLWSQGWVSGKDSRRRDTTGLPGPLRSLLGRPPALRNLVFCMEKTASRRKQSPTYQKPHPDSPVLVTLPSRPQALGGWEYLRLPWSLKLPLDRGDNFSSKRGWCGNQAVRLETSGAPWPWSWAHQRLSLL